jgi:hypothetical protein
MWLEWNGSEQDATARVYQSLCRVRVVDGKVRMFIDGREFVDPSVEDVPQARRSVERAAFRRSGGHLHTGLYP